MIKELLLYFALLLWFVVPSQAQPTIFAEDATGFKDELVEVFVKGEDFTDIVAMQFTFEWDSLVLEFVGFNEFNLPELNEFAFGPKVKRNYLTSVWTGGLVTPVTLSVDTVLFSMIFKIIGESPDTSKLWFSGNQLENVIFVNGEALDLESRMASLAVTEPVNTTQTLLPNFDLAISPNPFQNSTQVKFFLENNQEDFNVSIHSLDGKQIYNQQYDFSAGEHILQITSDMLPSTGMYLLHFASEGLYTTQKLIFENY